MVAGVCLIIFDAARNCKGAALYRQSANPSEQDSELQGVHESVVRVSVDCASVVRAYVVRASAVRASVVRVSVAQSLH